MIRAPSIVLVVIALGCSHKSDTDKQSVSAVTNKIDEAGAIMLARQAVSTNDTWVDRATFKATRNGSGWSVFVQRRPIEFGGQRSVEIDETGKVTQYIHGK